MANRFLLLALGCPLTLAAQAQPPAPAFTRTETGACRSCSVKLVDVATVGSADDAELLRDVDRLVALPGGGFVGWGGEGPLLRYDAKGKYVGTLGRIGAGPGEYQGVQAATAARGDSIALFAYGRLTVISTSTGRGRSSRSPKATGAFRIQMLPSGDALIQSYAGPPGPFVVMAPDGSIRHAFGPTAGMVTLPDNRQVPDYDSQQFLIAPAPSGGFWAASMYYRYGLKRWSTSGALLQTVPHAPTWWTPYDYPALGRFQLGSAGNAHPLPYVMGLWVDAGDRLFALTRVADAKWKADPAAPKAGVPGREGPRVPWTPTGGYARYYDALLDMYDAKSGEFLGSWRNDELLGESIGQDMIAMRSESADEVFSYRVWRIVVEGR